MGTNFLDSSAWNKLLKKHKLRDGALAPAMSAYWDCKPPAYEGRLIALDKLKKSATKLSKDAKFKAHAEVAEYLGYLLKRFRRRTESDQTRQGQTRSQ